MTIGEAIVLGLVQGLTEFLPVSSSGHLVVAEELLHLQFDPEAMLAVNVLLHSATLLALLFLYRKECVALVLSPLTGERKHQKQAGLLLIATIPAVVFGLAFESVIAEKFSSIASVSAAFLLTAVALWLSEFCAAHKPSHHLAWWQALGIGLAQAAALVPGISRSGATISAARAFNVHKNEALDFSFLMAIPVLAGATILTGWKLMSEAITMPSWPVLAVGFAASFCSSIGAIVLLRQFVKRYSFRWFSLYLVTISGVLFFFHVST